MSSVCGKTLDIAAMISSVNSVQTSELRRLLNHVYSCLSRYPDFAAKLLQGSCKASSMATPTTYSVRVSSETHKIETWLASDEALARQLQEEEEQENMRHAAADTTGTAPLPESLRFRWHR